MQFTLDAGLAMHVHLHCTPFTIRWILHQTKLQCSCALARFCFFRDDCEYENLWDWTRVSEETYKSQRTANLFPRYRWTGNTERIVSCTPFAGKNYARGRAVLLLELFISSLIRRHLFFKLTPNYEYLSGRWAMRGITYFDRVGNMSVSLLNLLHDIATSIIGRDVHPTYV